MRTLALVAVAVMVAHFRPAAADVIDLNISFDPSAGSGDRYLLPASDGGERYLFVGRTFSAPITLVQGDVLAVSFSGLQNFPIFSFSTDDHVNASITWAKSPNPVFGATFDVLSSTGNLIASPFLPAQTFLNSAALNPPFPFGSSDVFIGPTLVTPGENSTLDSILVDFTLTNTSGPVNVSSVGFEILSVEPVPEPSTWAMLLIGFAGIGFATYRRRHSVALEETA